MLIKTVWKWVFIKTLQEIGVSNNKIEESLRNIEKFEVYMFFSPRECIDWMFDPWEFDGYNQIWGEQC